MSKPSLADILDDYVWDIIRENDPNNSFSAPTQRAIQAIKHWILDELIGKDEANDHARVGYDLARNDLRAELRQKVEEL
jgi:hypothetical protein